MNVLAFLPDAESRQSEACGRNTRHHTVVSGANVASVLDQPGLWIRLFPKVGDSGSLQFLQEQVVLRVERAIWRGVKRKKCLVVPSTRPGKEVFPSSKMGAPIHAPEIHLKTSLRDRALRESFFSSTKYILTDFRPRVVGVRLTVPFFNFSI